MLLQKLSQHFTEFAPKKPTLSYILGNYKTSSRKFFARQKEYIAINKQDSTGKQSSIHTVYRIATQFNDVIVC